MGRGNKRREETMGEIEREKREQKRKKQNVKGGEGREVKEWDLRRKKEKEADIQEKEGKEVFTLTSSSGYM